MEPVCVRLALHSRLSSCCGTDAPPSTEGLIYNHVGHQTQSTFSNQYVPQQAPRCRIIRVSAVMGASLVDEIKKNVMLACPMSVTKYKDWTYMFEFRKTINKLSRRTDLVVTNKRNHQRQAKKKSQQIGDGGWKMVTKRD